MPGEVLVGYEEIFLLRRVVRHWHRLPGRGGVTILGGVQETCRCGTEGCVSGHGGDGLMVGLDGLSGLFQP